jgi:hypothetical protein
LPDRQFLRRCAIEFHQLPRFFRFTHVGLHLEAWSEMALDSGMIDSVLTYAMQLFDWLKNSLLFSQINSTEFFRSSNHRIIDLSPFTAPA